MKKALFIAILLLCVILRFYKITQVPISLNWDEASNAYNAYSILKTGKDEYGDFLPLANRSFDDYKPPAYMYLTVPAVWIFGLSEFAARLPSAVFGVLTCVSIFFLAKKLTGSNAVSYTSFFLLAINPWHVQFSRAGFEANVGLFFMVAGFTFLLYAIKKYLPRVNNYFYFLISAVFIALSFYSYHAYRIIVPLMVFSFYIIFRERIHQIPKKFVITYIIVILGLISPLFFTLFFSFFGLNTLYFAKKQIDRGDFVNVKSSLRLSQTFFYIGKKASDILYIQGKIIGLQNNLKKILEDIDLGYRVSEGALHAFNAEIYFSKIMSGKSENPQSDFAKGKSYLKSSIIIFEKIKADGKIPDTLLQNLEIIDPFIKLLSNTSDILPGIFGMEGPRTYLLLFQNNMILRPTGGFIGSYGILKVKLGRITEFLIHDVYDADGQLKGHVEPPFAIRRHLPTNHWYLRDSNFDVDFVKSASSSSNFLSVETGERADGVIGVDVSFVKNILHVIGPVYVENYKETVDENNLYILTQTHSEEKFLRSLYRAMMVKISDENIDYLLLAEALSDSISQKHLIFAFNNNTQNIFTVNGWSSSLWDERKNDEKVINDFLAIVEANLGVNKVNYFISRNLTHKVTIGDNGSISEELNISYKNTSNARMGWEYKNYLRIILPLNTIISEISINGIVQTLVDAVTDPLIYEAKNFKPPNGLEIEKINQDNKAVYGFIVKVPVGEITKIKIKYALAGNVSGLDAFSYNLKLFKQPGIDSLPYSFSLEFPNSLDLIKGKALYLKKIVKDENLIVDFAKK